MKYVSNYDLHTDIPQVSIQIAYGLKDGSFNQSALLLALATSTISILMVIVSYCVELADDFNDKRFEIEFTLNDGDKKQNADKIKRRCHMRKRIGNHICDALEIEERLLIVENVIFSVKKVTIAFELNDSREAKVILKQFLKIKNDGSLADALQVALKMDEKPIIGNITYLGNTTSGEGGEQEMVATQIDANVQENGITDGTGAKPMVAGEDEDNDAALEVYDS